MAKVDSSTIMTALQYASSSIKIDYVVVELLHIQVVITMKGALKTKDHPGFILILTSLMMITYFY